MSRAQKTFLNVAWLSSGQAIRQIIAILATVVLARFLGPAEFGLFAIMVFVNELAQLLVDFGMGSALIQRKEINDRLLASCFWINLAVGGVAAIALALSGPLIATYFEQPAIAWLLYASGANLLIAAATVLPQSLLARRLAFKEVALGALLGSLCGAGAATALAVAGFGVWALAAQPVVGGLLNAAFLFWRAQWAPKWTFSIAEVRGLLVFSGQLLGSNVLVHVTRNLTTLILGPAMGPGALGLITLAQTVTWLPIAQFSQAVVRATLPVFSQMQSDLALFRRSLYSACGMVGMLAFPMLAGIGILSDDLVPVVFGGKWVDAVPLVTVLSVLSMIQCVTTLSGTALLAAGHGGTLLRLSAFGLPLVALALWSQRNEGVLMAVVALSAATAAIQLMQLGEALRAIQGRWKDYVAPLVRPLICSLLMSVALIALKPSLADFGSLVRLILLSALGAAIYVMLSLLINRARMLQLWGLIRAARRG